MSLGVGVVGRWVSFWRWASFRGSLGGPRLGVVPRFGVFGCRLGVVGLSWVVVWLSWGHRWGVVVVVGCEIVVTPCDAVVTVSDCELTVVIQPFNVLYN